MNNQIKGSQNSESGKKKKEKGVLGKGLFTNLD